MKVRACSRRSLIQPCSLEGHAYQLDPYVGCEHRCSYCFALNEAETDWSEEILVYEDVAGQLQRELASLAPQSIYMGWNCDPYQPVEATRRQTHSALEVFRERGFSVCLLTKSDLVVCDVGLFAGMPGSSVGFSFAFQDEAVRKLFEDSAPPNEQRLEALKALQAAGIRTYVLICPVMPFLTDVQALIEQVAPCVQTTWVYPLSMGAEEDQNWQNVRGILDRHFPKITAKYRQIAFSSDHSYWAKLREELEAYRRKTRLDLRINV